jgi:hypothetical protein
MLCHDFARGTRRHAGVSCIDSACNAWLSPAAGRSPRTKPNPIIPAMVIRSSMSPLSIYRLVARYAQIQRNKAAAAAQVCSSGSQTSRDREHVSYRWMRRDIRATARATHTGFDGSKVERCQLLGECPAIAL